MAGTTSLDVIAQKFSGTAVQPIAAAGIVMTLVGFAFKIAAAPFHLWAPDTYQGGPVPNVAFIASASKVASFVVLGKVLLLGFGAIHGSADWHAMTAGWAPVVAVLSALSIVVGNLVALAQTNVRRLLAYSAVAHGGYTLLGLIAGTRNGFSAALFYITVYAVTLVGAFAVVGFVRRDTGGDDFQHFSNLWGRGGGTNRLLAGCMAIFMLSLAGLPPLPGFFGKFYLFSAALQADQSHGLLWLVIVALAGSLVSLYYYLIVLKVIFSEQGTGAKAQAAHSRGAPWPERILVGGLAAIVLILGILPAPLVSRIAAALE